MITFPNAKINLGLKVTGKRTDGFHTLETVFYPVGLCDILEINVAADGIFSFAASGLSIPGYPQENICVKAYHLMANEMHIPPVKMHLHKVIPTGAGLGGGSSDAAFAIKMIDSLFSLHLPEKTMITLAGFLGSDCAFFIRNEPAVAVGRGEELSPVKIDIAAYHPVIIVPSIHVNTREAYGWLDQMKEYSEKASVVHPLILNPELPVGAWRDELTNDFEGPVFERFPRIGEIRDMLYDKGAIYASMTGSGAGVYGLFSEPVKDLQLPEVYFIWNGDYTP